jgi:ribosomal protein L37AE/L43A
MSTVLQHQYKPRCKSCGEMYPLERMHLGYAFCLPCGDEIAKERKFTIAPLNKSNYVCITDMTMLKQLNPKRTT